MASTLWLGAEFHCLPLQGTGGHIGKEQLPQYQADRAGHESPGEDCGQPHQTFGVNRQLPVWLRPRQKHKRHKLCCQAAAREVSSCQQETLHGFRSPGEGVWSSTSEGHLVGPEKTWCGGVDCVTRAGDVCKCPEPCPCWWGVQWRVWSEGQCSPRLSTQPSALHYCAWSLITRVPFWGPLGWLLCWWPWYHRWIAWGMCQELLTWKEAMEKKGLRVNAGKMKIMICGTELDLLQSSGEFPCAVCGTGVGSNSIFCKGCKHWVHKKCSGLQRLTKDTNYRCTRCRGTARPLDGRPQKEVQVRPVKLEVVASFLLLPRRHALSSRWLWTSNHNTCENRLEVQGAATSPIFTRPLFQDTWPCVQLLCAEHYAPCQWNLAINKAKPPASAAEWQGNDQTDLQCQAARHCHHHVQWATCRPRWLSWMCRPTGDQEVAGSTPAEVGNILSWRLIMKYFLRSFSPFPWFKKGSCQFLAKECAQYWLLNHFEDCLPSKRVVR